MMNSNNDIKLRKQLVNHLKGGNAFATIEKIVEEIPFDKVGIVPENLPYSFYQQFYHIRIAQLDIFDYCRDEDYKAPNWPDDYWPQNAEPKDESEWNELVQNYFEERNQFCDYIMDSSNDLFAPFESNKNHNLFREAQLVIEHTSYHTGQLYIIKRFLS